MKNRRCAMNSYPKLARAVSLAISACAMTLASQAAMTEEELPFDEAQLYFELNHTDGDLGFHGLIDGDAWKRLEIEAPDETALMTVWVRNNLRKQGMTEIFFESEEPTFDELSPAQFFRRFPEGVYEVEGITLDDEELEAEIR